MDYSEAEWRALFETNLFSAFELSRFAFPLLSQHAASSIVNIGSVSGSTHVRTGAVYGMTKAALHQLTRNLACEWAEDGVRVNAVAPWYIRTRRTSDALAQPEYYEKSSPARPCAGSANPTKSPPPSPSSAYPPRASSPANASPSMAASCATGSETRTNFWRGRRGWASSAACGKNILFFTHRRSWRPARSAEDAHPRRPHGSSCAPTRGKSES
jgi:NAD(P)-dependent dehydrogenase (short-subunit alcohol dehydrogenase family)